MEISEEKSKSMAATGKTPQRVKVLINNILSELRMDSMYLGSHISPFEHRKDIEKNLMKYNKLNGIRDTITNSNTWCWSWLLYLLLSYQHGMESIKIKRSFEKKFLETDEERPSN
jgi:hypothetical protein